jgi:DNA replication protein DnaC
MSARAQTPSDLLKPEHGHCDECGTPMTREPLVLNGRPFSFGWCCADCSARHDEADRERAADLERQQQARRIEARVNRSGIPDRYRRLTFDELERDQRADAIDTARRWAAGDVDVLWLAGPVGVGKTHIAAAAAMAHLSVAALSWASVAQLIGALGRDFGHPARDQALDVLTGTGALVLDDLDKARATEFVAGQLFAAIDGRLAAGAPVLVTSNASPSQLAERFPAPIGAAVVSRLVSGEVRQVRGHDRRVRRAGT